MWFFETARGRMRAAAPEPKVWTISSPSMRTAESFPRSFGGGSTSVGSMMKSLSSTVTPWPASIFSMSSISMPSTFMRPFTGRPRLLIDFAWTRILPSGVASTVPLVLKGMSIFLSSLPFCLMQPFLDGDLQVLDRRVVAHEDVLVHERVQRRFVEGHLAAVDLHDVRVVDVEVRRAAPRGHEPAVQAAHAKGDMGGHVEVDVDHLDLDAGRAGARADRPRLGGRQRTECSGDHHGCGHRADPRGSWS